MTLNYTENSMAKDMNDRFDVERLNVLLRRYCLSLTRSEWDSEDLIQETWLRILNKSTVSGHANPQALLLRTAKNIWIDQVRRRKLHDRFLQNTCAAQQPVWFMTETDMMDVEHAFMALLAHFSPLQQTVLLMRKLFGYSVAETAKVLETTEGAVKAASYRALKWIHEADLRDLTEDAAEEDQLRVQARALAAAYEAGDVNEMLRLLQHEGTTVHAVGTFTARETHRNTVSYHVGRCFNWMAA